jgi:putative exporter of polyketide antibiotics
MDAAVGALVTLALLAYGLAAGGSAVIGVSFALVGFVFAAIAAVTAQVTENARVAAGIAGAALALAFVVRAIGDVGAGALSWLSPIGWAGRPGPTPASSGGRCCSPSSPPPSWCRWRCGCSTIAIWAPG